MSPPWFMPPSPCGPACDIVLVAGLGVRLGLCLAESAGESGGGVRCGVFG